MDGMVITLKPWHLDFYVSEEKWENKRKLCSTYVINPVIISVLFHAASPSSGTPPNQVRKPYFSSVFVCAGAGLVRGPP